MKRRNFILLVLAVIFVFVSHNELYSEEQEDYGFVRGDLIMVNKSTLKFGRGSAGVYVFFFEDDITRLAWVYDVKITFDPGIGDPVVKAKYSYQQIIEQIIIPKIGWRRKVRHNKINILNGIEIIFRDRQQMREYWL